ncbi:MAG: DUF1127 domain-containing protein [Gammaproteobacteria bacterium]
MTTVRLHQFVEDNDISSALYSMVQRIEAAAKKANATLSTWASRIEDRRQLSLMNDRLLADIGLTRVQVLVEVDKYFWQR